MAIPISRKQAQFLKSKARTVIFRGGIRSGKTWILCYKAIEKALQKRRFCIVSFSYPMLRDVCMYTMEKILTEQAPYPHKFYSSDKICSIDGTDILFRSGDQPDSLRGLSLDDFGIDEAREFKNCNIYDIMIGRISNSSDGQGFITSSPKGKNWAFELEGKSDTETIVQKTIENPFLSKEYIDSLKSSYSSNMQRQELDADIIELAGGDYFKPEWVNWYNERQLPPLSRILVSADTANSDNKTSCPVSIQVWGEARPKFYLLYDETKKISIMSTEMRIEAIARNYPGCSILIELAASGFAIIESLKKKLPSVFSFRPNAYGGKEDRAISISNIWESGNIYLPDLPYYKNVYLQEIIDFPGGQYVDRVDAMSQALIWFTRGSHKGMTAITGSIPGIY